MPSPSSKIKYLQNSSGNFDNTSHCILVIRNSNYLEKSCIPDISYISHQCANFSSYPRIYHSREIRWLGRYYKGEIDKVIILKPKIYKIIGVYAKVYFWGNRNKDEAEDMDTSISRIFLIMFEGFQIIFRS